MHKYISQKLERTLFNKIGFQDSPLKKIVINYTRFNRDKDPGSEKDKDTDLDTDTDTHTQTDAVKDAQP